MQPSKVTSGGHSLQNKTQLVFDRQMHFLYNVEANVCAFYVWSHFLNYIFLNLLANKLIYNLKYVFFVMLAGQSEKSESKND